MLLGIGGGGIPYENTCPLMVESIPSSCPRSVRGRKRPMTRRRYKIRFFFMIWGNVGLFDLQRLKLEIRKLGIVIYLIDTYPII